MRWIKKSGKHAFVRQELKRNLPSIWRFALSLCGRPDAADDLTQATCVRALERVDQVEVSASLSAWLLTICRSIWLNELRSQAVRQSQSLSVTPDSDLVDRNPDPEMNIFATEVFTEVMGLPEAQRATVVLVFVEGYSYREAAEILDVPIGTIMSRLSAARRKLKLRFQSQYAAGEQNS